MFARVADRDTSVRRRTDTETLERLQREAEEISQQHIRGEITSDDMIERLRALSASTSTGLLSRLLGI